MKGPLRALILGVTAVAALLGSLAGTPASAQSSLPTSSHPATGEWRVMRPSSFDGTIASAVEQCERDAALDAHDRLRSEHCVRLRTKLTANDCVEVLVPDGIVHDYMNGRQNGKSFVTRNVKKAIGRTDRALYCDLGDGVHVYWYTGIRNQSCNNIGITFVIPVMPIAVAPPPAPPKPQCRVVAVRQAPEPGQYTYLQGVYLPGCCPQCDPGLFIQGILLQSALPSEPGVTYITVCD